VNPGSGSAVQAPAQKVFICYRREQTAAHAGRLYDAMVARFGEEHVFMDVDLAPGVDFAERITEVVSGCLALIVVMGPNWATVEDEDGQRRIEDPADFVRLEVETGLGRSDVTPIPVLVSGARMPRREDLPPGLQPIARRNALELSEGRWSYDVGRLFTALDDLLPGSTRAGNVTVTHAPTPAPGPAPAASGGGAVLEGALVAGGVAAVARLLGEAIPIPEEPHGVTAGEPDGQTVRETVEHIVGFIAQEMLVLGLVGAALAIWIALRIRRIDPGRPGRRGLLVGALAGAVSAAIWALPVYLPDDKVGFHERSQIELAAIAVAGGLLGALIGSLWGRGRKGVGFVCGALAGFLFQLLVVVVPKWAERSLAENMLAYGLAAAAIAGLTLAAMVVLDRRAAPTPDV
jgi:hypothetical protein